MFGGKDLSKAAAARANSVVPVVDRRAGAQLSQGNLRPSEEAWKRNRRAQIGELRAEPSASSASAPLIFPRPAGSSSLDASLRHPDFHVAMLARGCIERQGNMP